MKATDEHENRARALCGTGRGLLTEITGPPAFRGYLAAVERIKADGTGGFYAPGGLGEDGQHDEPGHSVGTLATGTANAQIVLTVGTEYEQVEEAMDLDAAERLAYEILALRDLAQEGRSDG